MALTVLNTATSTMDVAKEMLKLGQVTIAGPNHPEPGGIMALHQTEGRGQRGRTWYSAPGESLCVTYFAPLNDEEYRDAWKLSILAGAAVANTLSGMFRGDTDRANDDLKTSALASPACGVGLKWPNDLIMSGKKLGGILVEIVPCSDKTMIALIGVGINVAVQQFPPDLCAISTSLAIEGLFPVSLTALANSIHESLDRCIALQSRYGFSVTMANWRQYDKTVGRRYRIETEAGATIGVAVEVDAGGALVVRTETGLLLTVLSAAATSEV